MDNKECLGMWNDCPESVNTSLCRKERNCTIEIDCMKEWLKLKQ